MDNSQRTTDYGQQTTVNGQRSHPDGSLLTFIYQLITRIIQIFMLRKENREICVICWQEKK